MNDLILDYLKKYSEFRERRNKNKWLGGIVLKKYGIEITPALRDQLDDLVTDIQNADRYWRKHTSENEGLRGSDYETKQAVEEQKMLALGYEPGWKQGESLEAFMGRE